MAPKPTKLPADLGKAGRALWSDVVSSWELGQADLVILLQACRTADHLEVLREAADGAKVVLLGRLGQTMMHPVHAEIRAERRSLLALLGALGLTTDADPAPEPGPRVERQRIIS